MAEILCVIRCLPFCEELKMKRNRTETLKKTLYCTVVSSCLTDLNDVTFWVRVVLFKMTSVRRMNESIASAPGTDARLSTPLREQKLSFSLADHDFRRPALFCHPQYCILVIASIQSIQSMEWKAQCNNSNTLVAPSESSECTSEHSNLLLLSAKQKKMSYNTADQPQDALTKYQLAENNEDEDEGKKREERRVFYFYLFICVSTALKSFEGGIVSSMMSDIQEDFDLDYSEEGTISASPDYGLAPGAFLAIFLFRRLSAHTILTMTMFGTSLVAIACAAKPTKATLILARAVGGMLWAFAATHFPVWINLHGPKQHKTIWLALTNVSLLGGVLAGYALGGTIRTLGADKTVSWVELYFIQGLMMAACGVIFVSFFDAELLRIDNDKHDDTSQQQKELDTMEKDSKPAAAEDSWEDLKRTIGTLFGSMPFVLAVAITGCISGGIVFALYFVAQAAEARGMDEGTVLFMVMLVFVTAPAPGIILGSWIVNKLGGYTDHVVTFGVSIGSAIVVLAAAIALPMSWRVWGDTTQFPFVVAFWIFAFAGAMAGPPLNGVAVSAVPKASHVASAIQFALANAAKIVVPQIGGWVCTIIGLVDGFHYTLVASAVLFVILSGLGLIHAQRERQLQQDSMRSEFVL